MTNAKQGGKGKKSSPSTLQYWSRMKAVNGAETHRTTRIQRHAKRLFADAVRLGKPIPPNPLRHFANLADQGKPNFPRHHKNRFPDAKMVMTEKVLRDWNKDPFGIHQLFVAGVQVEAGTQGMIILLLAELPPALEYQHYHQLPSGRRVLISSRTQG